MIDLDTFMDSISSIELEEMANGVFVCCFKRIFPDKCLDEVKWMGSFGCKKCDVYSGTLPLCDYCCGFLKSLYHAKLLNFIRFQKCGHNRNNMTFRAVKI